MDINDRLLLDCIQVSFPLSQRPFDELGGSLGISGDEALERISRMKEQGVIRQIGAVFNSAALGYSSSLVAFCVSEDYIDEVAARVSALSSVSHCYSRDNQYNLWFTITAGPGASLDGDVRELSRSRGVESYVILPALKVFMIGVFLRMGDAEALAGSRPNAVTTTQLTPEDRLAVRALQRDLPLVIEPFEELARGVGMSVDDLLRRGELFLQNGVMRRFAAVLRHRDAGYVSNAMICWRMDGERLEDVGVRFASHPNVSHCYQRPTFPNWPYALYTMVHCRNEAELTSVIDELAALAGEAEHAVLRTVTEYKKIRVSYDV